MPSAARNVLVLAVCLVLLGGAGWLATTALRSASEAPTQVATAPVAVDPSDDTGSARLTVLVPVTVNSGGGQRQVPAGTQFVTSSAVLAGSLPASATVSPGDTLICSLRIGMAKGQPVIDLVRCEPARNSPRG